MRIRNVTAQRADDRKAELAKRKMSLQIAEREELNLIPVKPFEKRVAVSWTYYQEKKSTKKEREEWFIKSNYNYGVVCGKTSENLVIVDCDEKGIEKKVFGKTTKELSRETLVVETGSKKGRCQIYYKTDYPVKGKKFHSLGIPLEILGQGNIGIFPPSWHPSGNRYEFVEATTLIAHWSGDIIEEIYGLLERAYAKRFKADKYREVINVDKLLHGVEEGYRDEAAIRIASWYRQAEVSEEDAEKLMLQWNEKLKNPLDEQQILEKVRSAYARAEPYHYKFSRRYVPETIYEPEIIAKAEDILERGDPFNAVNEAASLLHVGDEEVILTEWISALSSSLTTIKINTWQIGTSQKGKSHSKYTVIQLLPPEIYEVFTSASPLSFFYYIKKYGEWALNKKLIFIDETETSKTTLPMLRSLTGQTEIQPRHLSVHEAEMLDLVIRGKRTVWFTSVKTFGSAQIKNRFIHLNPDESKEQDERVWMYQNELYMMGKEIDREKLLINQAMTQKIIKDTEELKVIMPFDIDWIYKDRRWLFPIFVAFIEVITKVRYKKRKIKDGKLIAQEEDFETAKKLWATFISSIIMRVSARALTIYEILPENKEEAMTYSEIAEMTGMATNTIRDHCREMLDEGLVNARKRTKTGPGARAWELWKAPLPNIDSLNVKERGSDVIKTISREFSNQKSKNKNYSKTPIKLKKYNLDGFEKELWPNGAQKRPLVAQGVAPCALVDRGQ